MSWQLIAPVQFVCLAKNNTARKRFGYGNKAVLVKTDPQKAYTCNDEFATVCTWVPYIMAAKTSKPKPN